MANPTPVNTATDPTAIHQAGEQHQPPQLTVLHEGSPEFKSLQTNEAALKPYRAQLRASIETIRQFINTNANKRWGPATGTDKTIRVMKKLDSYLLERVLCAPCHLKAITLTQHRTALEEFAQALSNPIRPDNVSKALTCALELGEGLGVCADGEYLNIHEQLVALKSNSTGLVKHIEFAKEALINQNLLALVRSEAADFMGAVQAKAMEIHQVQTLRNALAPKWGLEQIKDKHAHALYAQQAGQMANDLLEETVTPAAIAYSVAEGVRDIVSNLVGSYDAKGNELASTLGMKNDDIFTLAKGAEIRCTQSTRDKVNTAIDSLKTEFGLHDLQVYDLIDLKEDPNDSNIFLIELKDTREIAEFVLKTKPDEFGLNCPPDELAETAKVLTEAHHKNFLGDSKISIEQRLTQLKSKRNNAAATALWGAGNSGQPWINKFSGVLEGTTHQHELRDEEERRKKEQEALLAAASATTHAPRHVDQAEEFDDSATDAGDPDNQNLRSEITPTSPRAPSTENPGAAGSAPPTR